jgi:hypothetical protein
MVVVMMGDLQSMGAEFERLPPVVNERGSAPSLFALPGDVVVPPTGRPVKQLLWLEEQNSRVQHAFGSTLGSVQLSSLAQDDPTVHIEEEPVIEPVLEPIEPGPLSDEEPSDFFCDEPSDFFWDEALPYCPPYWTFRAEGLMLWRTKSREIKIVEEGTGTPPRGQRDALLTTDSLQQNPNWGPRLTIDHLFHDAHRLELSYFGLHHWNSQSSFDGINGVGFSFLNIDVPFDSNYTSDFDGAQFVSAAYASEIHSVELNCRTDNRWDLNQSAGYPWYEYVDFLAGVRYFRLEEEFDLASTDALETSNYLIDTTNDLVGGQLGLIAGTYCTPLVSWNLVGKAGVYANMGKQSTLLRDDNNTVLLRDFTTRDEEIAFIGELNANIAYDFHPNAALTVGYSLVWLDGVALAPEQLDFTTTATSGSAINQNGGVLFNGLSVGLQVLH